MNNTHNFLKNISYRNAILIAIALVVLVFPDVIFKKTSISGTGAFIGQIYSNSFYKLLPEPTHRAGHHGYGDTGGAVFQSDPMIQFMRYVIQHFESPYWNPYSAAGSLGPETLVDQKFSPLTLLVALAGGSDLAFHIIVLSLYALAVFFLYRLLTEHFKLGTLSAVAAGIVYMLNGYHTANLNSNVAQAYLYFPMLLFALCSFIRSPRTKNLLFVIFSNVVILTTTFFPTSFLILVGVYLVAFGYVISLSTQTEKPLVFSAKLLLLQGFGVLASLGILAFVYLPIIESFSIVDAVEMYNNRVFIPAKFHGLLSFFTPKHFWESYNACDLCVYNWFQRTPENQHLAFPDYNPDLIGNIIFHMGVISSIVGAAAVTRWRFNSGIIVAFIVMALIVAVGRIFEVPGISFIVNKTYGFRSLGEQYWWMLIAVLFPLLVGFGFEAIKTQKAAIWPMLLVYAAIIGSAIYLFIIFGIISPHKGARITSLCILAGLILFSFPIFYKLRQTKSTKTILVLSCTLLFLMFAELTYYVNHFRYLRQDIIKKPTPDVAFLRDHSGLFRVANIGYYGLTPEYGSAYQIQQIESLNMNIDPTYLKFFQKSFLPDPLQRWGSFASFHRINDQPLLNLSLLNFLAVKYIVLPVAPVKYDNYIKFFEQNGYVKVLESRLTYVFENKQVFPRVFGVSQLQDGEGLEMPVSKDATLPLRLQAYTNDKHLLEIAKSLGINVVGSKGPNIHSTNNNMPEASEAVPASIADDAVKIVEYHHANIIIKANLNKPGVIVLPDTWNPNWKAFANGESVYIGKVNDAFRGIALPKGEWTVEMQYQPKTLKLALMISLSSFFGLLILFLIRTRIDKWLKKYIPCTR